MPTHRRDDQAPASTPKTPRPKVEGGGLQRHVLDLQRQAGNAATAATLAPDTGTTDVQRHRLDPDHADQDS